MANYIISYDLNGAVPSHTQVDDLLEELGATRARILETVWYVGWSGSMTDLFAHVDGLMSRNDQLIVIAAENASFRNLLIKDESFQESWAANA